MIDIVQSEINWSVFRCLCDGAIRGQQLPLRKNIKQKKCANSNLKCDKLTSNAGNDLSSQNALITAIESKLDVCYSQRHARVNWQQQLLFAFLLLIAVGPEIVTSSVARQYAFNIVDGDTVSYGEPEFGKVPTIVEGSAGQTVILSCIVHNLGIKRVSWIRTKDLQILTSGSIVFTSDSRFSSEHPFYGDSSSWGLMIKNVKPSDSGKYECQVNSEPKKRLEVKLVVREQQQSDQPFVNTGTQIAGPREEVVKIGTIVLFNCTARHQFNLTEGGPQHPVVWFKDGKPIYSYERGGMSVETDWSPNHVFSRLKIKTTSSNDVGAYSCTVPGSGSDTVMLLIDEANPQANTLNIASSTFSNKNLYTLILLLIVVYCNRKYVFK